MKQITIRFLTIDFWSRALFSIDGSPVLLTNVNKLFSTESSNEIAQYFKDNQHEIVIHGTEIDDDPLGTSLRKDIELVFADLETSPV